MAMGSVRMDNQSGNTEKHLQIIESKAVMDSRKAKEWGLDPKALPFGVELINQPVSFYQQYTYQIWSACTLFVVLVLGLFISLFYYFRIETVERRTVEIGQRSACGERQGGRVQPFEKCFPGEYES